jgi:hypothetical protein
VLLCVVVVIVMFSSGFNPEDGDSMFLQKVGVYLGVPLRHNQDHHHHHHHRRENLTTHMSICMFTITRQWTLP